MVCMFLCEGADWGHGGAMREYCDLTCEIEPDCENCEYDKECQN